MAEPAGIARAAPPADNLREEARAFLALAAPMVVSRIGVAAMGIADGVMLARHSATQLAVNGLAETLVGRLLEVLMIFVTAGLALVAQARAGGDATSAQAGRVWQGALALAVLGGVAGLLLGVAGGPLLALLGQPAALVPDAGRVILILALGVLPALAALVCAGTLEALGRPIGVAVAVVLANVLNIALNQWFIYGGGGVPALGAVGAAWSTTLVRILLAVVLFAALWWMAGHAAFGIRQPFDATTWRDGTEARRRGAAAAGSVAVLALLSLGLPVMAGWIGADAVAQITALFLALAPAMVVAWGLGDAAGLRVAALLGQGSSGGLRTNGRRLATMLGLVLVLAVTGYAIAPDALVRWAAHDEALVTGVLPLLPLGLAALSADAAGVFYSAMLRSLGVLRAPFLLHLAAGLALLPLAAALAFGLGWGLKGLLAAHVAMALLRAAGLAWMYDRHAAARDREAALG